MKQTELNFEPQEPMNSETTTTSETLLTIEELEAIPTYQKGVISTVIQDKFFEHKEAGDDRAARAIAYEWVVK
jgi:hypothetical protein